MSKRKITQGEWHLPHFAKKTDEQSCDCGFIFADECEECIGAVYFKRDDSTEQCEYPDIENAIANAKLICAAPEMLEVLETIENDSNQVPEWLWERIQSVIKKAVS